MRKKGCRKTRIWGKYSEIPNTGGGITPPSSPLPLVSPLVFCAVVFSCSGAGEGAPCPSAGAGRRGLQDEHQEQQAHPTPPKEPPPPPPCAASRLLRWSFRVQVPARVRHAQVPARGVMAFKMSTRNSRHTPRPQKSPPPFRALPLFMQGCGGCAYLCAIRASVRFKHEGELPCGAITATMLSLLPF